MKVTQETSNPLKLVFRPWLGWGVGAIFASSALLSIVAGQLHTFQIPQAPANKVSGTENLQAPGDVLTETALYFGLSKPNGGNVSETEWQDFVDREITPRFKDGLTILSAYGQYQDSSGKLVKEKVRVVVLIYPSSSEKDRDIKAIIDIYKQAFQQESVLRTTSLVKAAF